MFVTGHQRSSGRFKKTVCASTVLFNHTASVSFLSTVPVDKNVLLPASCLLSKSADWGSVIAQLINGPMFKCDISR